MSRKQAQSYSYHQNIDDCIIISINESNSKPTNFDRTNPKIKALLRLYFDDISEPTEGCLTISEDDTKKIHRFVDDNKDKVNTIIVHCAAGVSRIAGVACALSVYLNGSDMDIWNKGIYNPNILCYKMLLKELGLYKYTYDGWIKAKQRINQEAFELSKEGKEINKMFI